MGVVQTTEGTWISKERTCVDEDHIYIHVCVYWSDKYSFILGE